MHTGLPCYISRKCAKHWMYAKQGARWEPIAKMFWNNFHCFTWLNFMPDEDWGNDLYEILEFYCERIPDTLISLHGMWRRKVGWIGGGRTREMISVYRRLPLPQLLIMHFYITHIVGVVGTWGNGPPGGACLSGTHLLLSYYFSNSWQTPVTCSTRNSYSNLSLLSWVVTVCIPLFKACTLSRHIFWLYLTLLSSERKGVFLSFYRQET